MVRVKTVAIALGSNVGERESHLEHAVGRLGDVLVALRVSTFHETLPEGVTAQPLFLNAAAVGESADAPVTLLQRLQGIERASFWDGYIDDASLARAR